MGSEKTLEQQVRERIKFPRRLEQASVGTMLLGGLLAGGAGIGGFAMGGSLLGPSLLLVGAPIAALAVVLFVSSLVQEYRHRQGRSATTVYEAGQATHQRFKSLDQRDNPAKQRNASTFFVSTMAGVVAAGVGSATMLSLAGPLALSTPSLLMGAGAMLLACVVLPLLFVRPSYPLNTYQLQAMCHEHVLSCMERGETLSKVEQAHKATYPGELALVYSPKDVVAAGQDFTGDDVSFHEFHEFEQRYNSKIGARTSSQPPSAAFKTKQADDGADGQEGADEDAVAGVGAAHDFQDDDGEGEGRSFHG